MPQVVDYSYSHPSPWEIRNAGYIGAIRYLGYDFGVGARCISQPEYVALAFGGLQIALVWETNEQMMLRGASGGHADGARAAELCSVFGHTSPVYVARDFQGSTDDFATCDAYVDAFNGHHPCEPYGMYDYIEHRGSGWQCAAWSGNGPGSGGTIEGRRVSSKARLFQRVAQGLSNSCDVNEVLSPIWFQAGAGDAAIALADVPHQDPHVLVGTVIEVQLDLQLIAAHNRDSAYDPQGVDGVWGPHTEQAVKNFQQRAKDLDGNPLVVDGIVGEKTMVSLRTIAYLCAVDTARAA